MATISHNLIGKIMADRTTKAKLVGVLKREASSSQGHRLAIDVLRQDGFRETAYNQMVTYFNAMLKGLLD